MLDAIAQQKSPESYAGAVTAVEATNPTMCDGDHMVLGGA
jgi:hypothetical protein